MDEGNLREECYIVSEEIKYEIELLINYLTEIFDDDVDDEYYKHEEYDKISNFFDKVKTNIEPEFENAFKHVYVYRNCIHKGVILNLRSELLNLVDRIKEKNNLGVLQELYCLIFDLMNKICM